VVFVTTDPPASHATPPPSPLFNENGSNFVFVSWSWLMVVVVVPVLFGGITVVGLPFRFVVAAAVVLTAAVAAEVEPRGDLPIAFEEIDFENKLAADAALTTFLLNCILDDDESLLGPDNVGIELVVPVDCESSEVSAV